MKAFLGRTLWATLAFILAACRADADDLKEQFRHDFRRGPAPQPLFQFVGKNAQQYCRQDGTGLRISLPASKAAPPQTGLKFNLVIERDFEITLAYDLAKVDRPTSGYGNGLGVFIQSDGPRKEAATLGLLLPVSGDLRLVANRHSTADGGKRTHDTKGFPAGEDARRGQFRLARRGKQLRLLAATDKVPEFVEARAIDFGDEPVTLVRVTADTGGAPAAVEVVLKEIVIKTDSLTTDSQRLEKSSSAAMWVMGGVVLLAGGCLVGFLLWRRRRTPQE